MKGRGVKFDTLALQSEDVGEIKFVWFFNQNYAMHTMHKDLLNCEFILHLKINILYLKSKMNDPKVR